MDLSFGRMSAVAAMAMFGLALGLAGVTEARDLGERRLVRRSHIEGIAGSARSEARHDRLDRGRGQDGRFEARRRWRAHDRVPEYNEDRVLQERRTERGRSHAWPGEFARHPGWSKRDVVRDNGDGRFRHDDRFDGLSAFPSIIVGGGTFSGNVSMWHDRGNGSYFTIERYGLRENDRMPGAERRRSRTRIIDAGSRPGSDPCSYEAGVCVIRGR